MSYACTPLLQKEPKWSQLWYIENDGALLGAFFCDVIEGPYCTLDCKISPPVTKNRLAIPFLEKQPPFQSASTVELVTLMRNEREEKTFGDARPKFRLVLFKACNES